LKLGIDNITVNSMLVCVRYLVIYLFESRYFRVAD